MGAGEGQSGAVGLVLAGGGARGAYEIGALSALLPKLESRGERPRVFVGTSVGALNSAYLAATASKPVAEVISEGERIWRETGYRDVLAPLVTLRSMGLGLRFAGQALGLGSANSRSIVNAAPLEGTLRRLIPFERIAANREAGVVDAAAVVATSALTSRTVVFHDGGGEVPRDAKRGIDYVQTPLSVDHVRASAAIPALFEAVKVEKPDEAAGWYCDGGTRLNTPIKPALALGVERVIVIALDPPSDPGPAPLAGRDEPDVVEGIGQFLQAVLVDPMVQDVQTLAGRNAAARTRHGAAARRAGAADPGVGGDANDDQASESRVGGNPGDPRLVPYILVAPRARGELGTLAAQVFNDNYRGLRAALRSRDLAALGRMVDGGSDSAHGEILSLLFFAPEFADALLELGRRDAERWLAQEHDDGPWEIGPPPAAH